MRRSAPWLISRGELPGLRSQRGARRSSPTRHAGGLSVFGHFVQKRLDLFRRSEQRGLGICPDLRDQSGTEFGDLKAHAVTDVSEPGVHALAEVVYLAAEPVDVLPDGLDLRHD